MSQQATLKIGRAKAYALVRLLDGDDERDGDKELLDELGDSVRSQIAKLNRAPSRRTR